MTDREKADPDTAAGNIASGLMRLVVMPDDYSQRKYGIEEISAGIAEALRYLKEPNDAE